MNKMALPATVRSLMLFALVMGACAAPAAAPAAEAPAATEAPATAITAVFHVIGLAVAFPFHFVFLF